MVTDSGFAPGRGFMVVYRLSLETDRLTVVQIFISDSDDSIPFIEPADDFSETVKRVQRHDNPFACNFFTVLFVGHKHKMTIIF